MEPHYIVCWLSIYFEISSSSLLHVALVDPVVCFRCAAPVDPNIGASFPEIHNNWYQSIHIRSWEAIIYGGKSTIKVNVVKEHLLNKAKLTRS